MTSSTTAGLASVHPARPSYAEDSTAGPSDLLEIRVAKQDPLTGDVELDRDLWIGADGYAEIQLSDRTWIGHDSKQRSFRVESW